MVKRKSGNISTLGNAIGTSGEAIGTQEPINTWDTIEERAKQELAYYENIERVAVSQVVKELNAMLAIARVKPNQFCQLDRQALKAKAHLILSKIEASALAENQIRIINDGLKRSKNILT
jgi:hypothetical protein